MPGLSSPQQHAVQLLEFIDASPSPWHAGTTIEQRLLDSGFQCLAEADVWRLVAGEKYYVNRGGSSLIAFAIGSSSPDLTGFRIVGAHTDSPGLRIKPQLAGVSDKMCRLGVEIYGGPILATFTDRDLSLAGRLHVRAGDSIQPLLVRFERPLIRLPNLAIHMNRTVNDAGLKLDKQNELSLLYGYLEDTLPRGHLLDVLSWQAGIEPEQIVSWELNVYDTQPGTLWGSHDEFVADSQLDNLASCHAGLSAMLAAKGHPSTVVCGFFDHEEVGSESAKGANGGFLPDVLERISHAAGLTVQGHKQSLAQSFFISADMAHAYHPNFAKAYEPEHHVLVNSGPVIKSECNQRYATDGYSEAYFIQLCERAEVPYQRYIHRTDLGCGSTIGPMIAARLGIKSVDVGNPMWAMHSLRESAGVLDHSYLIRVLSRFFET